ncbi:related to multidrug resistance protein [Phialocephala subalpina]|uniref:Related to multidrug resistance protein n=1 Tax=Phialocephala subalpina TaxID=576137 RepID=A0A1L7XA27_9HELO|nr:related to multidrug resistance protein [Phialocephala subalpina]
MAAYDQTRSENDPKNSENVLENDENMENTPLLGKINSKLNNYQTVVENDDVEAAQCLSPLVDKQPRVEVSRNIGGVISILLLGVFVANADSSLVLATSGTISSEFNDLGDAGWLISSYTLAMCAAQSLYGQLSDIYGRKNTILVSYIFFAVGSFICGAGQSLPQVILGRLVAGVGGAGINCLVSIVIADMVPIREVASWRSYVNIAATTGRSLGGPIGGYLIDTIGWRWSFLGQAPPTILARVLVAWKLQPSHCQDDSKGHSHVSKLRRIDFLGATLLSVSIVCGLLVLELSGKRMPFTHPTILSLLGASIITGNLFLLVEAFWAKEPIFPLRLMLNRDVVASYINLGFQTGAQMAMMMLVPLYFQISEHASMTSAGAHLMPSVIGNAFGGLLAGYIIRRTGRYKLISIIGAVSSSTAYFLMMVRWHGHTSLLESLYIIPGGFGNGIALSTSFISLTAGVEPCQVAIASSGLYLSSNIGMVLGLSLASAILQSTLRKELRIQLEGRKHLQEIIEKSLSDIEYVRNLHGRLGRLVTEAYVRCLTYTHGVSLAGAIVALLAAASVKEHIL